MIELLSIVIDMLLVLGFVVGLIGVYCMVMLFLIYKKIK